MARTIIALCLFALVAGAGEIEDLRCDIAALKYLNSLELTKEQARDLLPIVLRGAVLRREFDRDRDRLMVKFHAALVNFLEEDKRDQGLSDKVMSAAGGLSHALKELGNRVVYAMAPLEREAAALCSAAQATRALRKANETHPLDVLRRMKFTDFEEMRDRLARQLTRARVGAGIVPRTQDRKERLRIRSLLLQVKKWDEGEYQARRGELLGSLQPGHTRAKIASAIRAIYRKQYGKAGPLAEHLFHKRMLPVLAERAGVATPRLPPLKASGLSLPGDMDRLRREVASMKADINLLNLVNGLHLTCDQLKAVMRAAKDCAGARPERGVVEERKALPALREVYAALRRCERAPGGAVSRLQPAIVKRGGGYLAARRRDFLEVREKSLERLMEALSPEQGEVIRTYKACLVPPKNLRDPVRVGQAKDNSALERMVDTLRRLPLDENSQQVADRLLAHIESHEGRFPANQRPCKIMLILGVAYEVQALDDAGFVARRAELAERLTPLHRLTTLKDKLMTMEGDAAVIHRKVAAFLLDARIVPLAQDRLKRMNTASKLKRPDIPKAEICEDGKCGKQ